MVRNRVLIIGGRGRIGRSVAADLAKYTDAEITITSRDRLTQKNPNFPVQLICLDIQDQAKLAEAIASHHLIINCAGPFHDRQPQVLEICIQTGVNYLDVSDDRAFTIKAISHQKAAQLAGITAIINTGIFPGISNSMVRQGVEKFDQPELIHLSYVVAGSGGAGVTVMRTTFLGLQRQFSAWIDEKWQEIKPYSDREIIYFPSPYHHLGVYWFDLPEAFTLRETFPVKTVITKFGSVPDFYNQMTWMVAHLCPRSWLQNPQVIEFLAQVSYGMTNITNYFTGIGVAIRAEVTGKKDGKTATFCGTLVHENTAIAAGIGTGSIAELLLAGKIAQPGVWSVEQALPSDLFEQAMHRRGINIQQSWQS